MARGVNKVILIGHLGANPEVRYMPSGGAVTNITIATSESWKDKQTNETHDRTEWHRVVLFNRLAEIAGEYLEKGSKVYVEGRLQTRKWQDKNGQERYTTEIICSEMQMLDSKNSARASSEVDKNFSSDKNSTPNSGPENLSSLENFDDDIPF